LRDRLPLDQAAHLSAQLPLLIRGLYYDRWDPASPSSGIRKDRHQEEFVAHVADELKGMRPVNAAEAMRTVFSVLDSHITKGLADKVASCLPGEIRVLWPSAGEPHSVAEPNSTGEKAEPVDFKA
jgi:uncharacterized protein (DUF2267 family)